MALFRRRDPFQEVMDNVQHRPDLSRRGEDVQELSEELRSMADGQDPLKEDDRLKLARAADFLTFQHAALGRAGYRQFRMTVAMILTLVLIGILVIGGQ